MKRIQLITILIGFSVIACTNKLTKKELKTDNTFENSGKNDSMSTNNSLKSNEPTPKCIQDLIAEFTREPIQNPPRKVYSYRYKNQLVFYIPPICCDQYSVLYDSSCKVLGHPDGGITGRGDGKVADFSQLATNEKLIWEDKRK